MNYCKEIKEKLLILKKRLGHKITPCDLRYEIDISDKHYKITTKIEFRKAFKGDSEQWYKVMKTLQASGMTIK